MRTLIVQLALLVMVTPSLSGGAVLSIEPSTTTVQPGEIFAVSVMLSGGADVYGWQFSLGFDNSTLAVLGASEGDFLSSAGATLFFSPVLDNAAGVASNAAGLLIGAVPGVNGSGALASIQFQAASSGQSTVSLFNALLLDSSLSGEVPDLGTALIQVSDVPEPSAIALTAVGILAMLIYCSTRSRRPHVPEPKLRK